ncbi:tetratricopeptide repeat protein [Mangrovitalea sediminis]|uniref:tetratricopeptide repeat protein n=1 Tax=Mangrovitalea sediminis TaxID=1982043 RepID=UPI000BE5091A|nr:hypothetical protein [Mangrovitalea sediminis]
MQAQRRHQKDQAEQSADVARKLIEANLCYQESNDPEASHSHRLQARRETRQLLNEVLAREPANASGLGLMGRVEMDDGHMDKAREYYEASVKADPGNAQLVTNLGYWALLVDDAQLALDYFTEALAIDRQSTTAFCGAAHAHRQLGHFDVAYLHYRRLIDLAIEWPSIFAGMLECAESLQIDAADQALADDAIRLLQRDELPHQNLSHFICAILHQQYDLDNPHAEIFLDAASEDELLMLALERTLLADIKVEELVTMLRQAILLEVRSTGTLRESLQRLTLALGVYAERIGYALVPSEEEVQFIGDLDRMIYQSLSQRGPLEDTFGALMITAMYSAIFNHDYAVMLGHTELEDWPAAMRPMLAASYFNRAEEETYQHNFDEKQEQLGQAREDLPHAWPCWSNLSFFNSRSLREELEQTLGVSTQTFSPVIRVLMLGTASGQRALEMARYYEDVEIIAVDEELANIGHATRRARELGLENIVFWPWSLASRFINDGHRVHFIALNRAPSERVRDIDISTLIRDALVPNGVIHLNTGRPTASRADEQIRILIEQHRLSPTRDNLLRLRRMVINNHEDEQWAELVKEKDFYATAGCRSRWFHPESNEQLRNLLDVLSSEVDWKLVRATDEDQHELATAPVLAQLQAQRQGNSVRSLVGHGLSLYFQRRR